MFCVVKATLSFNLKSRISSFVLWFAQRHNNAQAVQIKPDEFTAVMPVYSNRAMFLNSNDPARLELYIHLHKPHIRLTCYTQKEDSKKRIECRAQFSPHTHILTHTALQSTSSAPPPPGPAGGPIGL